MVIIPFVFLFVIITANYVLSFPGGIRGFSACVKVSLKKKGLGHKTKSLREEAFIRQRGKRLPCDSYHLQQWQGQLQRSSQCEQPQEKPAGSDEQSPSEQRCRDRPEP